MAIFKKIYSKFYRESLGISREIGHALGWSESFLKNARGSQIMIYHGICQKHHTRFNPIFLTRKLFEEHLKLYKKYCNVISLDDFYQQRFSKDRFNICLTFDDGFANNYNYVLPLLAAYQVPATFFVTGIRDAGYDVLWNDFLGIVSMYGPKIINYKNEYYYKGEYNKYTSTASGKTLVDELRDSGFTQKAEMMKILHRLVPFKENLFEGDYWLQMSKDQIRDLSRSPWATIGAHGYYHNDLAKIPVPDAVWEMIRSKTFLEELIDKQVNSLAFPYGSYTLPLVEAARKAGYNQLLAMDFLFEADSKDATMRERFTVNPFISPVNQLYATINRRYDQ